MAVEHVGSSQSGPASNASSHAQFSPCLDLHFAAVSVSFPLPFNNHINLDVASIIPCIRLKRCLHGSAKVKTT